MFGLNDRVMLTMMTVGVDRSGRYCNTGSAGPIYNQRQLSRTEASFRGGWGGRRPPPPQGKRKKEKKKEKKKKEKKREKKEKKKEGNYEWRQITTYKMLFFPIFQ